MKTVVISALLCAFCLNAQATGNASEASANASATLSAGVGSVVAGSALLGLASGQFVVESVENTAEGVIFLLKGLAKGASEATQFSVKVAGNASGAASVAVGQSVEVVAEAAGSAIIASGKIIAFIPNEVGKSLVHHSRLNSAAK